MDYTPNMPPIDIEDLELMMSKISRCASLFNQFSTSCKRTVNAFQKKSIADLEPYLRDGCTPILDRLIGHTTILGGYLGILFDTLGFCSPIIVSGGSMPDVIRGLLRNIPSVTDYTYKHMVYVIYSTTLLDRRRYPQLWKSYLKSGRFKDLVYRHERNLSFEFQFGEFDDNWHDFKDSSNMSKYPETERFGMEKACDVIKKLKTPYVGTLYIYEQPQNIIISIGTTPDMVRSKLDGSFLISDPLRESVDVRYVIYEYDYERDMVKMPPIETGNVHVLNRLYGKPKPPSGIPMGFPSYL